MSVSPVRPEFPAADVAEIYDWFAANGVREWIPERAAVHADPLTRELTYSAHRFDGERGFERRPAGAGPVELRTVPLVVDMPDRVRELAEACGLQAWNTPGLLTLERDPTRAVFREAAGAPVPAADQAAAAPAPGAAC